MRDKRKQYLYEEVTITDDNTMHANKIIKKPNYPEERSYYNRIKLLSKKEISDTELAALKRIASNGLDARGNLENLIRDLAIEITQKNLSKERLFVLGEMIKALKTLRGDFVNQN